MTQSGTTSTHFTVYTLFFLILTAIGYTYNSSQLERRLGWPDFRTRSVTSRAIDTRIFRVASACICISSLKIFPSFHPCSKIFQKQVYGNFNLKRALSKLCNQNERWYDWTNEINSQNRIQTHRIWKEGLKTINTNLHLISIFFQWELTNENILSSVNYLL